MSKKYITGTGPDATSKMCPKCKETKERHAFKKSKNTRSGMSSWCKECCRGERKRRDPYDGDPEVDTKICIDCSLEKTLISFYKNSGAWDGRRNQCSECQNDKKRGGRFRNYGLTQDEFEALLAKQEYRCANPGCRILESDARGGVLCIDHCHETGRVRGLLCHNCNTADGFLGSDPERILGLLDYLNDFDRSLKKYPGITWYNS